MECYYWYAECRYAEFYNAECRYAKHHGTYSDNQNTSCVMLMFCIFFCKHQVKDNQ
jgi:hypothetical protein